MIFWTMMITRQLTVAPDFHSIFFFLHSSKYFILCSTAERKSLSHTHTHAHTHTHKYHRFIKMYQKWQWRLLILQNMQCKEKRIKTIQKMHCFTRKKTCTAVFNIDDDDDNNNTCYKVLPSPLCTVMLLLLLMSLWAGVPVKFWRGHQTWPS